MSRAARREVQSGGRRLPAHVALNAVFLVPPMGGLETMVRALMPELVRQAPGVRFSIFCNPEGREGLATEDWAGEVELVTHPLLGRPGLKAASELTVLGWLVPRAGAGLLNSLAMTGPLLTSAVHVVTLADVTWIVAPDTGERHTQRLWRTIVPPVARRADRVIAISEAGKRDIVTHLGVPPERIDVTLMGFGASAPAAPTPPERLRASLALGDGPVVLSVSAKKEHKNLPRLVEAWAAVLAAHPGATLVLPGKPTAHEAELRALADRLGIADRVRFPDYVSNEDLEGLYALASAFVFASLNEGFGLPVLEAQRRGVPVACSNASSLPEAGGDAARYFDPLDVPGIAAAMRELLEDCDAARALVDRGRTHAATFTWERCAAQTLDSYARAWSGRDA